MKQPRTQGGRLQELESFRQTASVGRHEVPDKDVSGGMEPIIVMTTYIKYTFECFERVPFVFSKFVFVEVPELIVRKKLVDRL